MTEISVQLVEKGKPKQPDNELVFGKTFTDHMFLMDYEAGQGWHDARIVPYGNLTMSPAAVVLHYGQTIFDGMKAFRTQDGRIAIFRTLDHLNRLNRSAEFVCIPKLDVEFIAKGLRQLIALEKEWVPSNKGTALYIRPFVFATDALLGVSVASKYTYCVILSPVGPYYASGFKPVALKVEDVYVRAVKGGLGEAKTAANYAASLRAGEEAHKEGFGQVLWLDGVERKYVEEVGAMNIGFIIDGEFVTPSLSGTILDGITRRSVLTLAKDWGMKVHERRVAIEEVYEAHEKGKLQEVFSIGTAAVISPVSALSWKGRKMVINDGQVGPITQKFFDAITGIQQGRQEDKYGWLDVVAKI